MAYRYNALMVEWVRTRDVKPDPRNPHEHPPEQLRLLTESVRAFGFNVPLLVDRDGVIVAGHARHIVAKQLGYDQLPIIRLDHLTPHQARAFQIADNRLVEIAKWNDELLGEIFLELTTAELDFSLDATGFTMAEIDLKIEGINSTQDDALDDLSSAPMGPAVSQPGDLWHLQPHEVLCGNSLEPESYQIVMAGHLAAMVLSDPPYNVKIGGNVSGRGKIKHREFAMASGEMSKSAYDQFLARFIQLATEHSEPGSLCYIFSDWRHSSQLQAVAEPILGELKNVCVWVKDTGFGSLYRSAHELILVFKHGTERHRNNVQLGRFGRNRTNVWSYPSPHRFGGGKDKPLIALHPTVKPVAMLADAILDASSRGDIVLDPFLGSGSTLLAAERVGRRCCGIELDPLYVDLAIRRWQLMTGKDAIHAESRETFNARARGDADAG